MIRKGVLTIAIVVILAGGAGCKSLRFAGPSFGGGFLGGFLGALVGSGLTGTSVTVERNCFENGQPIDCDQIPAGQSAS